MAIRINSNLYALGVHGNLADVSVRMRSHYARLASGLRIATAADDAAGLGISERMRSEIRSLTAVQGGLRDGISLLETAEGGIQSILGDLHRIRELVTQAANGTLSDEDRANLDAEYQELVEGIDMLAQNVEFNGINLIDVRQTIEIVVDSDGSTIDLRMDGTDKLRKRLEKWSLTETDEHHEVFEIVDTFVERYATTLGEYGAYKNRLASVMRTTATKSLSLTSAESRIRDVDYASEMAALVRDRIIQASAASVLAQANAQPTIALELLRFRPIRPA